ncbi:MAG: translocation/assembly module TamB domain-containing protein [Gammaproteobacteria bacterium]
MFRYSAALILCVFFSALYFFTFTDEGSHYFIVKILPRWVDGYQIDGFSGNLSHHFVLKQVNLQHKDYQLTADHIEIKWSPITLFRGQFNLQTLTISNFKLKLPDAPSSDTNLNFDDLDFEKLRLPKLEQYVTTRLPINIKQMNLIKGKIRSHAFKLNIDTLEANQIDFNHLTFKALHFEAKPGHIHIESKAEHYQISWKLQFKNLNYYLNSLTGDLFTEGTAYLHKQNLIYTKTTFTARSELLQYQDHLIKNLTLYTEPKEKYHALTLDGIYNGHSIKGQVETEMYQRNIDARLKQFKHATGQISISFKKRIHAKWDLKVLGQNEMVGHIHLQTKPPFTLSGSIQTTIKDFKFIDDYLPNIKNLKGHGHSQFKVSGSFFNPQFDGVAIGEQISFRLPHSGAQTNIDMIEIKGLGKPSLLVNATGTVGEGAFTLTGTAKLEDESPELRLHFEGKQLVVSNSPEYYIVANPVLSLTFQDGKTELTGEVWIPNARILPKIKNGHVGRSKDIKFVSKTPKKEPVLKFNDSVHTDIKFKLSDKVHFEGYGLKSNVTGEIRVTQKKNRTLRAVGTLHLKNGKYKTHNRNLDISYGQIMFTGGPITQPLLDIRGEKKITQLNKAHKNIQDLTVGLHLKGPLHAFKLIPFSKPALPESDIISYLALGQASNQGGIPGTLLLDSASQISQLFGQGDILNYDLASKLKFDIGIQTPAQVTTGQSPLEETAITIGKQLSEKLYLNYSVGILDSASQVGLKYLLGKNISLEAQTGTKGTGADFLVTLEGR